MLGDTAVAVHPDPAAALDKAGAELREKLYSATAKEKAEIEEQIEALSGRRTDDPAAALIQLRDMAKRGVMLELPLTGRKIPLIADEWAKPELGSGCVKITPAHDANDYEVWQRHPEIGLINIMTVDGTLNDSVPEKYRGLKMHTRPARRSSPTWKRPASSPKIGRPRNRPRPLRPQQDADRAVPGRPVVHEDGRRLWPDRPRWTPSPSGRVKIVPERYAKGYLDWLGEKRDWPIGRQLWWGHRIPVWTCVICA